MLTGFDRDRPRGIGIAFPDFTGPHLLVASILAALRRRDHTGEGQEIHLTQLSAMISLLGAEWMQYKDTGDQPPRRANRDPNHCPHGIYRASASDHSDDEWLALAVTGDEQWAALCRLIGRPELTDDVRFANHDARKRNEDALDEIIDRWTADGDKWDLADRLQSVGIAAAAVEHLADTYDRDPQLRHHYQIVHQPVRPEVDVPIDREAAQWVGHDLRLRRSPGIGEHNEHVICDLLGRSNDDYVQLVIDDVLG